MNDLDIKKYETTMEETPEEVRKFLWSLEFKKMVGELAKYFSLDEGKKNILENCIFENIIGFSSKENSEKQLSDLELTEEKKDEITTYIYDYFITPILAGTLRTTEFEKNEDTSMPMTVSVSPMEALTAIQQQLSKTTVIAPTKRDYSMEKAPDVASTPTPTADPYREFPEK